MPCPSSRTEKRIAVTASFPVAAATSAPTSTRPLRRVNLMAFPMRFESTVAPRPRALCTSMRAAVRLDDALGDREPEAGAAALIALGLPEAVEQARELLGGDALSVVAHRETDSRAPSAGSADLDQAAPARELDRVADEVARAPAARARDRRARGGGRLRPSPRAGPSSRGPPTGRAARSRPGATARRRR